MPVSISEHATRAVCVIVVAACLVAFAGYLGTMYTFGCLGHGTDPNLWQALVFAVIHIAFMLTGLVMLATHLALVTLGATAVCCAVATIKAKKREWQWITAGLAATALMSHAVFLLYPSS